jgi:DNA-directed RNA polymerase specialized sigma54-like protein
MSKLEENTLSLRDVLLAVRNLPSASYEGTIDNELSSTSENPVMNKVIYEALERKEDEGTSTVVVGFHNADAAAHNDIRLLVQGLTERLNAIANSTDTDLDDFKEIVEYIQDNRELIDGIASKKVNVADIVNNLTTDVVNKPLSAAQGVALKALIDAINNKGYQTESQVNALINNALGVIENGTY